MPPNHCKTGHENEKKYIYSIKKRNKKIKNETMILFTSFLCSIILHALHNKNKESLYYISPIYHHCLLGILFIVYNEMIMTFEDYELILCRICLSLTCVLWSVTLDLIYKSVMSSYLINLVHVMS